MRPSNCNLRKISLLYTTCLENSSEGLFIRITLVCFEMIAERPKPSTRSTTESLELFAGLEFPEVPNRPIILERGSKPTKTTSVQIQEEDLEDAKDVTESTNLLQKDIVTLAESKPLNIQPSANLSTLYATEVSSLCSRRFHSIMLCR